MMGGILLEVCPVCRRASSCVLTDGVFKACLDGALHVWKTNSNFVRPDMSVEGAHNKGTETGSAVFSVDGRTILTRGGDDTVKCASS